MHMRFVDTSYFMVSVIYQAKYAIFLLDTAPTRISHVHKCNGFQFKAI